MKIDTTKRISHRDLESQIKNFVDRPQKLFSIEETIDQVINYLQSSEAKKKLVHIYVTNVDGKLEGIFNASDLLYYPSNTQLKDIIDRDFLSISEEDSLEKGLKILSHNQMITIPVINKEKQFVGTLEIFPHQDHKYHSDNVHYKNLKEDIFQFIGFSIEQKKYASTWNEYRLRMPWLLCNLVGGLICAVISEVLKEPLIEIVILAFFIPLVLGLGESVGIQSMTLSLRFLHIRTISWNHVFKRLFSECKSSLLLGISSATIVAFFYFAWSIELLPIVAISIAIVISVLSAATFGALFPIILHSIHLDPKVAAGPVVLMMADIITMISYLGISTLILT